jgi:hypothetical protein
MSDINEPHAFGDETAIEEIAKIIDPSFVEPMRSRIMTAWAEHDISQENAERYMADNEESARTKAREVLAFLKGESRTRMAARREEKP